jgi:eukaryotic-like serine/threonine-protein kinase
VDSDYLDRNWAQIDAILAAALEVDPDAREAYVHTAAAGDADLAGEVLALLGAAERSPSFLEDGNLGLSDAVSAALGLGPDDGALAEGTQLGRYRILRHLGRGGSGNVYFGERTVGDFDQRVAIKVLRRGTDTDDVLARFRAEGRILGSLNHPNIAHLLDGGATPEGQPYLVMELVKGVPITTYCAERRLPIEERLRLFCMVGKAVEHAHRNLVVHRDLKPGNILVSETGEVKLLDFGIAKLLEPGAGDAATLTRMRAMTPEYASPEQIRGAPITTASDVFQLGVLLYELLTGRRPFNEESAGRRAHDDLHTSLLPPSAAALRHGRGGGTGAPLPLGSVAEARRWSRALRGDLDTVVARSLRLEPERRYGSVAELVDDVERHLSGRAVRARPDTLRYRAEKLVRRRPDAVAAGAAAALAVIVALFTLQASATRLENERNVAQTERIRAEDALERTRVEQGKAQQITAFLTGILEGADPEKSRGEALTVREVLDRGLEDLEHGPEDPEVRAELLSVVAGVYHSLGVYDRALELADRTLALSRETHGLRHPTVVRRLRLLGGVQFALGEYEAAVRTYDEAVKLGRQVTPGELILAESLQGLSLARRSTGQHAGRVLLLREAVDIRSRMDPSDAREAAESLKSLGDLLWHERDHEGALRAHEQELAVRRSSSAGDHPQVAETLARVGRQRMNVGDLAGSVLAFNESVAMQRRVLGAEHPSVVHTLNMLGIALRLEGDLDGSEAVFREAVRMQTASFGPEHAQLVWLIGNLARTLLEKGELDAAEGHFRESLALLRATAGENSPHMGVILHDIARVYAARGDLTRAEAIHRDAVARQRSDLEPEMPLAVGLNRLGTIVRRQGRAGEAVHLHREALEIARDTRLNDVASTSLIGIGLALATQGDTPAAHQYLLEAVTLLRSRYPERHPQVVEALRHVEEIRGGSIPN